MTPARLELSGICKRYPGVFANQNVSLRVQPGSIHAVLGENGAGKSTLMKIIYGAVAPDAGSVSVNGNIAHIRNPREARALGISMVFQHFSLFDTLTVAENVWLGQDKSMSLEEVTRSIIEKATLYGLDIEPTRPVHSLSVGEMQRVEIIRALLNQPQLLILDEPTSVLTPQAVEKLFAVLRKLATEGCSILYISHKLDEIRALCDACMVMRAGEVTGECDPKKESNASLSQMMIGAAPASLLRRDSSAGTPVLNVRRLHLPSQDPFGVNINGASMQVNAGEVVGIAGVSGNGQRELLYALSGEDPRAPLGSITLFDVDIARLDPERRRRLGLHFVPEERLGRGAVPSMSLAQNLLLTRTDAVARSAWACGWLRLGQLHAQARDIIDRFNVKTNGPDAAARSLSGGNLQKFIVGREIEANPKLLMVSQPTWGVDVGAAAQIRGEILALRDAGCAVLVFSDELEELFEICDRLHVIARGRLSPSLPVHEANVRTLGEWMSGLWPQSEADRVAA
ncbi:MAG: ABC transporter ATP-binding protein [Burkholderiales bacterium]